MFSLSLIVKCVEKGAFFITRYVNILLQIKNATIIIPNPTSNQQHKYKRREHVFEVLYTSSEKC